MSNQTSTQLTSTGVPESMPSVTRPAGTPPGEAAHEQTQQPETGDNRTSGSAGVSEVQSPEVGEAVADHLAEVERAKGAGTTVEDLATRKEPPQEMLRPAGHELIPSQDTSRDNNGAGDYFQSDSSNPTYDVQDVERIMRKQLETTGIKLTSEQYREMRDRLVRGEVPGQYRETFVRLMSDEFTNDLNTNPAGEAGSQISQQVNSGLNADRFTPLFWQLYKQMEAESAVRRQQREAEDPDVSPAVGKTAENRTEPPEEILILQQRNEPLVAFGDAFEKDELDEISSALQDTPDDVFNTILPSQLSADAFNYDVPFPQINQIRPKLAETVRNQIPENAKDIFLGAWRTVIRVYMGKEVISVEENPMAAGFGAVLRWSPKQAFAAIDSARVAVEARRIATKADLDARGWSYIHDTHGSYASVSEARVFLEQAVADNRQKITVLEQRMQQLTLELNALRQSGQPINMENMRTAQLLKADEARLSDLYQGLSNMQEAARISNTDEFTQYLNMNEEQKSVYVTAKGENAKKAQAQQEDKVKEAAAARKSLVGRAKQMQGDPYHPGHKYMTNEFVSALENLDTFLLENPDRAAEMYNSVEVAFINKLPKKLRSIIIFLMMLLFGPIISEFTNVLEAA